MGGLTKIYHNHIPKTGGTYVRNVLIDAIKKINFEFSLYTMGDRGVSNKEYIVMSDLITGHLGVETNSYLDDIKTFTTVRNPIDRVISNYLMVYQDQDLASVSHFNDWIFNDDIGYLTKNNLQSRFLTTKRKEDTEKEFFYNLDNNNHKEMIKRHHLIQENGFGIKDEPVKYGMAKLYLDKCSFVMTTENLQNDIYKVFDLIDTEWNIKIKRPETHTKIQKSQQFKKMLNKKQINKIISLNIIDMEIWEYAKKLA